MAIPTRPAQTTAAVRSRSATGCVSRARTTATVAPSIASRMKKCQALKGAGWAAGTGRALARSVGVAELIIQPGLERGRRGHDGRFGDGVAARPSKRRGTDHHDAKRPDTVRQQPGQPVEALVDGRREYFLTTVLRDVVVDDLIVR